MKNMKRFLAFGMAACMVMGSMTACGSGKSASGSSDAATTDSSSSDSSGDNGEVKLTMLGWEIYQQAGMEALAAAYHEKHPNVTIEVQISTWSEYWTKLEAMANSNSLPDIFWMHTNEFSKYAEAGMLADLTDLYADEDPDYYHNNFPANLVENFTYEDKIYGVMKDVDTIGLVYNKDIFDEAGVSYPDDTWTWDDLVEASETIHEKTGKYLLTSEATGGDTLMMMMQSCGANFVNEDGEAYIVGNEVAEKCINLYVDLVKNDVVKLVNNWDEYIATITGGEAAGIVNGNWITATLMSTEDQKGLWGITTMPKVDGVDTATNYANNGGSSWYVTSNCQNVELAEDFLASTFGSSTEFYDTILPEAGAISCYLPAGESKVYNEPNEFFGGQPIFSTIVEYSSHIPEFTKTPYHYEARECVNTAVVNIVNGTSKEDALQEAQDTLAFKMTE